MLNTHFKYACRLSPAFFILILVLAVFSCAGKRALVDAGTPRPFIADSAVAEALAMQPPSGVDPAVFNKLRDELVRQLTLRAEGKLASAAPIGSGAQVRDLAYDAGTGELTWSYANAGDYNIDGIVGVADITPLATYFGANTTDGLGNDALETWLDGDGSGTIGIGDITPLAMGFGFEVDSYMIMSGDAPATAFTQTGSADFSTRNTSTIPPTFAYVNTGLPTSGAYCKVIPRDSLSVAGIDSLPLNIATGGVIISTGTIGPEGGTLDGGAVTVVFEEGALADDTPLTLEDGPDDEYDEQVSDGFYIRGLPDSFTEPIAVSIKLNQAPAEGDNYMLALDEGEVWASSADGVSHGAVHFTGDIAGGVFTASIPPTTPDSGVSSLRSVSAETDKTVYITVVNRRHYLMSNSGKFLVYFPGAEEVLASAIADALDEAYSEIGALGLSWARRTTWPLEVALKIRGPDDPDGESFTSRFYGVNGAHIILNSTNLATTALGRATAGHELLHVAQYLYDNRNRVSSSVSDGGWLWIDEATATWFERLMEPSLIPSTADQNIGFIESPLALNTQDHGYGASMFITYMARNYGNDVVGSIIKKKWDSATPIDALKSVSSSLIGIDWRRFAEDYMKLAVYGDDTRPLAATINGMQLGSFKIENDLPGEGATFSWSGAPDLSVRVYRIQFGFYVHWEDTDYLSFKFWGEDPDAAPDNAAFIVCKYADGNYDYVGTYYDHETSIFGLKSIVDASGAVYIMVVNQHETPPYTSTRPDALYLQVTREEDFMARLRKCNQLILFNNAQATYTTTEPNTEVRDYNMNPSFDTIQWSGNQFWSEHEAMNPGQDDFYVEGTVDPDAKLLTLHFNYEYDYTSYEGRHSYASASYTFSALPLQSLEYYLYPGIAGSVYGPSCGDFVTSISHTGYHDGYEDQDYDYVWSDFAWPNPSTADGNFIAARFDWDL